MKKETYPTYNDSIDLVTNRIKSFKDIDKNIFKLNFSQGSILEYHTLWKSKSIFKSVEPKGEYVIQCKCGRVDNVVEGLYQRLKKKKVRDNFIEILCTECSKVNVAFNNAYDIPDKLKPGFKQLSKIFEKASSDNYMTMCYFFWHCMAAKREKMQEIIYSSNLIFDMYMKNNLEGFLISHGISNIIIEESYHNQRQYLLCLLSLNHIIEIDVLYDLILSLVLIAESEIFLIGDDGRTINNSVGVTITRGDGDEEKDTVKMKVSTLKTELNKRNYNKVAKLIKTAFNYEVRNAFAHADYIFTETGIYLSRNKREITYDNLQESFIAATFLLQAFSDLIKKEQDKFIESGGYEESGWKIEPIIQGNSFSIRISTSSPACGPTGKKRNKNLIK